MRTILIIGLIIITIILIAVVVSFLIGINFGELIARGIADVIGGFLKAIFVEWWYPW